MQETVDLAVTARDELSARGLTAVFVIQTRADVRITRECLELLGSLGEPAPVIEEYDPLVLRGLYSLARGVITFRFHAAIFALSVGTPALEIYRPIWGRKAPGLFADLGIPDLCMTPDEFRSRVESCLGLFSDQRSLEDLTGRFGEAIRAKRSSLRESLGGDLRI